MERDLRLHCYIPQRQNFNSHAHVERDRKTTEHDTDSRISTHTLTWSVTHGTLVQRQISNFNSHAHVERDFHAFQRGVGSCDFNSHAHVERDSTASRMRRVSDISTHTLTWSVTAESCNVATKEEDFNSHAHVERDRFPKVRYWKNQDFNSHAHVERDDLIT